MTPQRLWLINSNFIAMSLSSGSIVQLKDSGMCFRVFQRPKMLDQRHCIFALPRDRVGKLGHRTR
jgi:hypothetical protein